MIDILSAIVRGCFKLRASRQSLALARILSADLKQTDAMALRVYRIKTIACVNPQGRRMAKVRAFDCAWIKCVERLPFVTEDLNLVKSWLADVNVPLIVYRQSAASLSVRQVNCSPEITRCIEDLNACVPFIEHKHFTSTHGHLAR